VSRRERDVVLEIAAWLEDKGLTVLHERRLPSRPERGSFTVTGVEQGRRPDLVVRGRVTREDRVLPGGFLAVEVKPGYNHRDILDGFDAVLGYFLDYACGARYEIDGEKIEISAIVLVTAFGNKGYLFQAEGKFDPKVVKGPWDAYPMTFTVARLLWRQRDNIVRRLRETLLLPGRIAGGGIGPLPEVGVMVADPRMPEKILLMLSARPYHWYLEPDH